MPENARLKLYTHEPYNAQPLDEFALCDVKGAGMLYEVTLSAAGSKGGDGKVIGNSQPTEYRTYTWVYLW